ncbi:DUF6266 family protein [Desertivirga arenae]|uniref:DUF6266 family protein n=1 Tax=Desertivirga arenae TaxID=2810309 RepID=UPI001A961BF1|nr:DUF6266 family protein [Pedobacter sp. SYSU D00823]
MGKFSNGIFGNFYGKIGNVVGSSWRGIDYLKSLPKINKNRIPSQLQIEQQQRFSLMTAFMNLLRPLLSAGYKNQAIRATAYNVALSENIKNAIAGAYPEFVVDFPEVILSSGVLPLPTNLAVAAAAGLKVDFSWTDNSGKGKSLKTDKVFTLAFCPELDEAEYTLGDASREAGALSMVLPAEWEGKDVETYLFLVSVTGKEVTRTYYGGRVTIIA